MSYLIAITGKGGVGKTTISGLIINSLIRKRRIPVLAVDADPNTCLDAVMGVKVEKTVGKIREEAKEIAGKGISSGISKQQLLEMKIAESLVESKDFDLIAMGRSEGPGCYCYANNVLKAVINQVSYSYPYIVMDNEAGLENLSRRIVQKVDVLIIVSDPSKRGFETVKRLHELSSEMGIEYNKLVLIINRVRKNETTNLSERLKNEINADMLISLPDDNELIEISESTQIINNLPENSKIIAIIDQMLDELFN